MSLLPAVPRRRAEEFARLLDAGGGPADPTLAPLVALAASLRSLPLGPTPSFRDSLRQRLVAVAAVQPAVDAAPAPATAALLGPRLRTWIDGLRVQRGLTRSLSMATAVAGVAVLVGGIGLAGSRSLPGDPFYAVKRGAESLQLATAGSTEAKGERHLQFAATRLAEIKALAGRPGSAAPALPGRPEAAGLAFGGSLTHRLTVTLRTMDDETVQGTRDLTRAFAASRDTHPLQVLTGFVAAQQRGLSSVLPSLPGAARAKAVASLALLEAVDARAGQLFTAGPCTAACAPATGPTGGLTGTPPGEDRLGTQPCRCAQQPGGTGSPGPGAPPGSVAPTGPEPTDGAPLPGGSGEPVPSSTPSAGTSDLGGLFTQIPEPTLSPLPTLTPLPLPLPTVDTSILPLPLLP